VIAAGDENAAVEALLRYVERHPAGEMRTAPDLWPRSTSTSTSTPRT